MNYWEQFAEMLGLELGQEFSIVLSSSKEASKNVYKITKNGVFSRGAKDTDGFWGLEQSTTVEHLISGLFEAVPKPWKPKEGELYWYYSKTLNQAISRNWNAENYALCLWKYGNCFKTEKEANEKGKEIMKQIQKEYEEA